VIVWVLLCAVADIACAVVITLGAGLIGFGLARRMYRVPAMPRPFFAAASLRGVSPIGDGSPRALAGTRRGRSF